MNRNWRTMKTLALTAMLLLPAAGLYAHEDHEDEHEQRITVWQDGVEVFIPHPPLIAGEPAQLTAFITSLDGYRPVESGKLRAHIIANQDRHDARIEGPLGNGVFLIGLPAVPAGEHQLRLTLEREPRTHQAEVQLSFVTSVTEEEHEDHDDIIFTKAQQLLIPFSTEAVIDEPIAARITAPAAVEAMPGHRIELTAAARGMLQMAEGRGWPVPGQRVRRGEELASILPLAGADDMARLASDVEAASARAAVADATLARIQQLVSEGIVAERQLIEAEAEAKTTRSALHNLQAQLATLQGRSGRTKLPLRAPIDGVVTESALAPGQMVEANTRILTVIDDQRMAIRVRLLASDLAAVIDPQDLRLRRPGSRAWERPTQRLSHRSAALGEDGIFSLLYEIPNDGSWTPGLPLIASLAIEEPRILPVVPETAVLDDDGVAVVIVQHGGEEFERRQIKPGLRAAGQVAVLEGLSAGERVITRGAYAVLLAGRGPVEADHGHSH